MRCLFTCCFGVLACNDKVGRQAKEQRQVTSSKWRATPSIPRGVSWDSTARGRPQVAPSRWLGLLAEGLCLLRLHQGGKNQLCLTTNILHTIIMNMTIVCQLGASSSPAPCKESLKYHKQALLQRVDLSSRLRSPHGQEWCGTPSGNVIPVLKAVQGLCCCEHCCGFGCTMSRDCS